MARAVIGQLGPWAQMRAAFRWEVPARFNIAERCCDSWAAFDPDRVALIEVQDGARVTWTYGQLSAASDRLANALAARGVQRGDRVGLLLPQGAPVLLGHFAAYKLGAVALPLFTLFGPDALGYRLADSGAVAVLTDDDNLDKLLELRADLPGLRSIVTAGRARDGAEALEDLLRADPIAARADTGADDPGVMIYTSGTTGTPKGVLHAHRFLLGHLPSVETTHPEFGAAGGDVAWTPADWAWIGGLMDLAMPALYHGVPLVAQRMRKFSAEAAYDLIRGEGITRLFLPPTALKLMRQAKVPQGLAVRSISSGGEALGADLLAWGKDALGAPINEIYGQTECNLVLASVPALMEVQPGALGRAVPGMVVEVQNSAGAACGAGEVGEICVQMPNPVAFLRYWNKPEQTADKLRNGWLRTGDLGVVDAGGVITFASRDDDVITSAGYRIGPSEIETCLTGHADVVMAAVVGLPDAARTESVTAFVVLAEGAGGEVEDRLIAHVKARLSPHMAPRRVIVVDSLPMTATGKIQRRDLRETYANLYSGA